MVIRNRLFALLLRIAGFALLATFLAAYSSEVGGVLEALGCLDLWGAYFFIVILGFEILFNLVDLRKGINGVPAHFYAPVHLTSVIYNSGSSILFLAYCWPNGFASGSVNSVIFHFLFLFYPILEWILLLSKGTVRWYTGFTSIVVPGFYVAFAYFRTLIWPKVFLYGSNMYAYPFLYPKEPLYPLYLVLFLVGFFSWGVFFIFLNNLAAGKYTRGVRGSY